MIGDLFFWAALPVAVSVFWLLPERLRYGALAILSAGVLIAHDPLSAVALAGFSIALFRLLPTIARGDRRGGQTLALAVSALAAFVIVFKAPAILGDLARGEPLPVMDVLVPLGSSYYIFKMIHVAVDAYRRREFSAPADHYFCYLFLFTAFVAGPIQRLDFFLDGDARRFSPDHLLQGATRTAIGLIKQTVGIDAIVFLRNRLESLNAIDLESLATAPPGQIWVVLVSAYLIGYLNLSAYTDVAIGTSRLFGFTIQENFNWPVAATSLNDFWRRWHMTLSNWCQNYVYAPVLGWMRNPYLALFASFQVMGLWHAFTLNRVAWGLFHMAGIAVAMQWQRAARRRRWRLTSSWPTTLAAWVATQIFVAASFVFVIAEASNDVPAALHVLMRAVMAQ